jgi:hypothetical protein
MPVTSGGTSRGSESPKTWPGGGAPDVKWAPEKLEHAAKLLQQGLESLAGSGALTDLQAKGLVTAAELGNWDAGQTLAGTAKNAHGHITQVFQDFVRELAAAVEVLRKTADNYGGTEEALTKRVRKLGDSESQQPSQAPTWHNVPSAD